MKAIGMVFLAVAIPAGAQNIQSIGGFLGAKSKSNTTRFYSHRSISDPYRMVGNRLVDLSPLLKWIQAGKQTPGTRAFTAPNPMPDWKCAQGKVISVTKSGALIDGWGIVTNAPPDKAISGEFASLLVIETGTYDYTSVVGSRRRVRSYDYGKVATAEQVKEYHDRLRAVAEAKAEKAAQANAVKMSAADARAIAFLKKRIASGSASSAYRLAMRYLEGKGVPKDQAEAIRLLKLAHERGDKNAEFQLSELGAMP